MCIRDRLKDMDLAGVSATSAEFVHRVTEAMKLAFADLYKYCLLYTSRCV